MHVTPDGRQTESMKGPRDRLSKISKPYALQLPSDDDDNDDKEDDDQRNMSYNHLNHVATTKTNNQTNIAITLCVKRVIEFSTFRLSLGS